MKHISILRQDSKHIQINIEDGVVCYMASLESMANRIEEEWEEFIRKVFLEQGCAVTDREMGHIIGAAV